MVASESVEEMMDEEHKESSSSPLLILLSILLTSLSSWWFAVDLLVGAPDTIRLTPLVVGCESSMLLL